MASTEDTTGTQDQTGDALPVAPGTEQPPALLEAPAKPARKRATRKATAKSAAKATPGETDPAPDATAEPAQPAEAPAGAESPQPAKAARKRATRKTTRKAAATPAAEPEVATGAAGADAAADAADAAAAEPASAADDAIAPEPATAETAVPEADALEAETAAGEEDGDDLDVQVLALDVEALLASAQPAADQDGQGEEPAAEGEDAGSDAPSLAPAFGLMFQAPEPVVPRRAPRAPVADAFAAAEPEAAEQETDQDDSESDESDEGSRRSRRRRGGKGRRGRGDEARDDDSESGEGASGDEATAEESPSDAETGDAGGEDRGAGRRGRRGRGRGQDSTAATDEAREGEPAESDDEGDEGDADGGSSRRRRRRRRSGAAPTDEDPPGTVTKVREPRKDRDAPQAVKGSTRLEAKKQRRREGREAGRRRTIITEAEFLARRESVERTMVVRERDGKTQIGVLEDGVLVEHYVSRESNNTMAGNVYLGRVQNVLPSMEAAFIDIGKGRNAVLYAGEVNWDAAGLEGGGQPKRIENALSSGDTVLVQVTKDPIGHKGARLTSQISLPGRYLVYVPEGSMTGISRKLPDTERSRLKAILKQVVPDSAGVIVRTAAEGASEEELRADVERLTRIWQKIQDKAAAKKGKKASAGGAPVLLHGEPDMTVRVIRDVFNEDFSRLVVSGATAYEEISDYLSDVAPDLADRLERWTSEQDVFAEHRIDEALAKAMDRKVWLPSGGSLVIDRTEAMTVVDVNTGKFVGSGGNLEETVTKNNIEAAEEIVRQLRLRDIGGIIVIDFIDMVLESNRDLVVRRLVECLGRDRTKHQVAEVTSLGLVQMTRKRVGSGLIEVFSEQCEHCSGRGIIVSSEPIDRSNGSSSGGGGSEPSGGSRRGRKGRGDRDGGGDSGAGETSGKNNGNGNGKDSGNGKDGQAPAGPTAAQIAAAAHAAAVKKIAGEPTEDDVAEPALSQDAPREEVREGGDEQVSPEAETAAAQGDATPEQGGSLAQEPGEDRQGLTGESSFATERQTAAEAAPKRRRRGRVVAPAGPPKPRED
ncbi:MAG: Rne/Rng family ribonuclease [Micrococcales bacterium]|nr:Rne/Rng family ribonuclease [Micrococcales bacterium]